MNKIPKLAIFDIDGTIAENGHLPASVVAGVKHLQERGCITTVSTGRNYQRIKFDTDVLKKVVSPKALMIVEHGSKVVDRDGKLVFGSFFEQNETDHLLDFIRANQAIIRAVWSSPADASKKIQYWCSNDQVMQEESGRSEYADVFTCSLGELRERLSGFQLTCLGTKLWPHIRVNNLQLEFTRSATKVVFMDGAMEFMKNNINKGLAVSLLVSKLGLQKDEVLLAGNGINDVDMLDIPAGFRMVVGSKDSRETILAYLSSPEDVVGVDSPTELGEYLQANF